MNWSDTNNCEPYNIMRGQVKHDKGIMKRLMTARTERETTKGRKRE